MCYTKWQLNHNHEEQGWNIRSCAMSSIAQRLSAVHEGCWPRWPDDRLLQHQPKIKEVVEALLCLRIWWSAHCWMRSSWTTSLFHHTMHKGVTGRGTSLPFSQMYVARQMIGGFQSQMKSAGRPRSAEYQDIKWLNVQLCHWTVRVGKKLECSLCSKAK